MKTKIIVLLFLIIQLVSCTKDNGTIEITDQCIFYDNLLGSCFSRIYDLGYDEIVIREIEEYEEFGEEIRFYPENPDCETANLPFIDFENYSLVSKYNSGSGCSQEYNRKIFEDIENKKIIYEILVTYTGPCGMLLGSRNWVLIPRIPDNYSVEFKLKEINKNK
jgi:hypothetical protein